MAMTEYLVEVGKAFDASFQFIFIVYNMKIAWSKLNKLKGLFDPSYCPLCLMITKPVILFLSVRAYDNTDTKRKCQWTYNNAALNCPEKNDCSGRTTYDQPGLPLGNQRNQ